MVQDEGDLEGFKMFVFFSGVLWKLPKKFKLHVNFYTLFLISCDLLHSGEFLKKTSGNSGIFGPFSGRFQVINRVFFDQKPDFQGWVIFLKNYPVCNDWGGV